MSDITFDLKLDLDTAALQRKYGDRLDKAQNYLDNEVIRTSHPFVPFLQGTLASTVTIEEPGMIVYVQPYARRQYYGDYFSFTKTFHPLAGSRWTERAREAHLKDWTNGVRKILAGGNA